jgi:hypothetical protein
MYAFAEYASGQETGRIRTENRDNQESARQSIVFQACLSEFTASEDGYLT